MNYYFPPNPFKIGDCLLTIDILAETAENEETICYASELIVSLLRYYNLKNVRFRTVSSLEDSFVKANIHRKKANCIDLQRLNCFYDYPNYHHLFEENSIPERCRYDWLSETAIQKWGIQKFTDIFRSMLNLKTTSEVVPPKFHYKRETVDDLVLIFPHAATQEQQLSNWSEIVSSMSTSSKIGIVASKKLFETKNCNEYYHLSASDLVATIGRAKACLGGATGLSHLSSEMGVPTLILWKYPDYQVFSHSGSTSRVIPYACEDTNAALDYIHSFLNFKFE